MAPTSLLRFAFTPKISDTNDFYFLVLSFHDLIDKWCISMNNKLLTILSNQDKDKLSIITISSKMSSLIN